MSLQIVLKHSSIQDKNPTSGQLGVAELAANLHESGPFLSIKDASNNVWRVGGVVISEDPPFNPTKGAFFFNSASDELFLYDGDTFKLVGSGGGGGGGGGFVNVLGGDGLTATGQGTDTITLNVGEGPGINVTATLVEIDRTQVDTWYAPLAHVNTRDGHPVATQLVPGMMSAADKSNLDNLSGGALVVAGPCNLTAAFPGNASLGYRAGATARLNGDLFVNTTAGTAGTGWTGLASGTTVKAGDRVIWSSSLSSWIFLSAAQTPDGIWQRVGTTISPLTTGDTITTTAKFTSSATVSGDSSTTLVTKGYVDSADTTLTTAAAAAQTTANAALPKAGGTMTGVLAVTAGTAALPAITPSGDPNTGLYSSGADVLDVTTGGTAKVRFDNTTAPLKEIFSSVYYPIATQVDIGTDPNQVPLNGYLGTMAFQDSAGVNLDQATINTATISSAAVTAFSNVPLLTGGGLKFPATQVASADPNTLDDYEEGTFTPAVAGSTTAGTGTYVTRSGRYTKTGNRVYYQIWMEYSGHTGTGDFTVTGLPFTTNSTVYSWNPVIIYTSGIAFTASHFTQGFVERNSTIVYVQSCPTGGGAAASVPMDPAGSIMLGGHYEV